MAVKPLCIDLCCGIGGWAKGFLAAGYRVIGFDVRQYSPGYPGELVLQDVRTLNGYQFRNAHVIVASPPCEQFSRFNWPESWGKACGHDYRAYPKEGIALFEACRRIGAEAGIPTVIENVRTAQRFIGKADCNFGSFYLWGDVPLLRPQMKFVKGGWRYRSHGKTKKDARGFVSEKLRSSIHLAEIPFDLAHWLALSMLTIARNDAVTSGMPRGESCRGVEEEQG